MGHPVKIFVISIVVIVVVVIIVIIIIIIIIIIIRHVEMFHDGEKGRVSRNGLEVFTCAFLEHAAGQ